MRKIVYISDEDFLKHQMTPGHPESPDRLTAIEKALKTAGLWQKLEHITPIPSSMEQLLRVHSREHIDSIYLLGTKASAGGLVTVDPDTYMNADTLNAARKAAGAAVLAVDKVLSGDTDAAFCAVRPPGHHAERDRAMGFCFFNNIAVGGAQALETHGLSRVAIVDFDVHHGNGTQDIFKNDARVLFCSTHQYPFYPGTGDRSPADNIVNVPLPAGADGRMFRQAVSSDWLPALHDFKPEMLFISAGFDAHREDPLALLGLVEEDYYWVTRQLVDMARQHCRGRVVSSLEGGYNLAALGASVTAHVRALLEC
ncbi:MAG TPA: histone deacetylase family protein [Gammaproteobacteria bacterium]